LAKLPPGGRQGNIPAHKIRVKQRILANVRFIVFFIFSPFPLPLLPSPDIRRGEKGCPALRDGEVG
jgi:hypothetical protein